MIYESTVETSREMNTGDHDANDDAIAAFLFVSGTDARILSLDQLLNSELVWPAN